MDPIGFKTNSCLFQTINPNPDDKVMVKFVAPALAVLAWLYPLLIPPAAAQSTFPNWALVLSEQLCRVSNLDRPAFQAALKHTALPDGRFNISRLTPALLAGQIRFAQGGEAAVSIRFPASARAQVRLQIRGTVAKTGDLFVQTGPKCKPAEARILHRSAKGYPLKVTMFSGRFDRPVQRENLNPPVPAGQDPGGVAVALIDSGLNYTLHQFAQRLARDRSGNLLGYDFADNDTRPYDLDPSRSALFPIHHGTAVASIIIREAPKARLIPMRYPGRVMAKFADVVKAIANGPARIVSMPLGGNEAGPWLAFRQAVKSHPELLFIVSAGNNGRDIDERPIYPASFNEYNILVVTSSDSFGRIADRSNWGAVHVDIATPGEQIDVIDHRGGKGKASGTSYAVPRITALAARLAEKYPTWNAARLKREILGFGSPLRRGSRGQTKHGWIVNPALAF